MFDNEPKGGAEDVFSLGFTIIASILGFGIAGVTTFLFFTREVEPMAKEAYDAHNAKDSAYIAA